MPRYILEFDSPEELQAALEMLKGQTEIDRPPLILINKTPQSILVSAKPAAEGIHIEIHPRGTMTEGKILPPNHSQLLG